MRELTAYALIGLLIVAFVALVIRWRHDPHKAAYRQRRAKEHEEDQRSAPVQDSDKPGE